MGITKTAQILLRRTTLHGKVPLSTLGSTRVVTSITELDKRPTIFYDDAKVEDESGLSFTSGAMSIFPSRGGVLRLMNSIVVGSMVPAWRRAVWNFSGVTWT